MLARTATDRVAAIMSGSKYTRRAERHAGDEQPKPYRVTCPKSDGTRRLFQTYATRGEAEAVVRMLRAVGCPADVDNDTA